MRNPPSYHHNHHQHVVHDIRSMFPVVFPCMVSSPASQIQAGILRLGFEIENLYKRMQPRKDKELHKARETLIARIGEVIATKWPTAKVEVFGSFKTNLYLPTSDIDLVVVDSTWRIPPFYELKDELIAHDICDREKVIVLDNASVPIVKLTDKLNGVKVDIGFNIANAQESAKLTQEFISLYPCLPYLVIVLKQFLVERELNEVYSGGMSSYSLILMVISFLKQMRRCGFTESSNYGEHLFRFLHFYGYEFDYLKFSVSIRSSAGFVTRNETQSILSIKDPLCATNDVARGSYRFAYVHHAFKDAYRRLLMRLETVSSPGLASREPVILSEIVKCPYLPQYTHFDKSHFTESHVGVSNSTGSMSSASSDAGSGSFGDTDSDSEVPAKVVLSEATAGDSSQKLYADVVKSSVAIPKPSSSTDLSQLDSEKPASVADTNCDRSGKAAKDVETEAMLDRLSLNVKSEKEESEVPADKTCDDNKEGVTEQPYADEILRIVPFAVQKCTLHDISSSAIEDPVS